MTYVLIGGAAVIGLMVGYQLLRKADMRRLARMLRWVTGGAAALITAFLMLRGQVGLGSITGYAAYSILKLGRLGPLVFDSGVSPANVSEVRSRAFAMRLDHDSGEVSGRVISGEFAGADLMELGEAETRRLLAEVADDPDSLALLETWLDRNRAGWREHFAAEDGTGEAGHGTGDRALDPDAEARQILGVGPEASADEIRAAHRRLLKAVHPDQGGSTYLAARINAAKDRLLKRAGR